MLKRSNARVATICGATAVGMIALAYASVPLYRLFCQVTGFNGTTQRAVEAPAAAIDRTVLVRFDANIAPDLGWEFVPLQPTMTVRLGETAVVHYRATNRADRATVGSAVFNVTPDQSGIYFNKLQCFCFTEQRLAPGETVDMAVSFFVDPAYADDKNTRGFNEITLSYTFYPVRKGDGVAVRPAAPAPGKGS